jgi:competence protein ComEC
VLLAACRGRGAAGQGGRDLVISRVMVDPTTLPDDRGEWIEITNAGSVAADLRDWALRSGNDGGFVVRQSVVVPPSGSVIVARSRDARLEGGRTPSVVYSGIALGNGGDWLALHDPRGETRDSLAWITPPRGVPIDRRAASGRAAQSTAAGTSAVSSPAAPVSNRELIVRILDIGQGDAILIQNGGSTVIVDGGPDRRALGRWLDHLGVRDTIDAVILTHAHSDHFEGLRELFATRRHLAIRSFWSNGDSSSISDYLLLNDSVAARASSGRTAYHDTDSCAYGVALCTLSLRGGAMLHILRPLPRASLENNRSAAVKLVGPDSASFTMWLAGDAELAEQSWFADASGYASSPGMRADVLKADHHGSCDGVSDGYLDVVRPSLAVVSLGAVNEYGHMHEQAKATYRRHGVPWYRTDQNGTITLRSPGTPGGKYTVSVERGTQSADGPSDRVSRQLACRGI